MVNESVPALTVMEYPAHEAPGRGKGEGLESQEALSQNDPK